MISEKQRSTELINQTDKQIELLNQQLDNSIQTVWEYLCKELNIKFNNCTPTIDKRFAQHNINFNFKKEDNTNLVVSEWNLAVYYDLKTKYTHFKCGNMFIIPKTNSASYNPKRIYVEQETLHIYYHTFNMIVNHQDLINTTMLDFGFTKLLHDRNNLFERKKVLNHIHDMVHERYSSSLTS